MTQKNIKLPRYWKRFYGWLYGNEFWSNFFNHNSIQTILTCGYNNVLTHSLLKDILHGNNVLQIGKTFGHQIEKTADKIGQFGQLDLIDVSLLQLNLAKKQHQYIYPQINFLNQNAAETIEKQGTGYDVVICYMILHEVPPQTKSKIINNALRLLNENGKAIFIDYHRPSPWHPLYYMMRMVNRLWQPFAEKLWDLEISNYCSNRLRYNWRTTLFFGNLYQKTVVTKRAPNMFDE